LPAEKVGFDSQEYDEDHRSGGEVSSYMSRSSHLDLTDGRQSDGLGELS